MYRVYWGRQIHRQLAEAYDKANATKREQILAAIESLDEALATNPAELGESRESLNVRIVGEGPLAVSFRIDPSQLIVRVSAVSISQRD